MTAEPLPVPEVEPVPSWVFPPPGGFTAEHFLRFRGLPKHTQLIDGSLVFVSPQTKWHVRVINLLCRELDRQAPDTLRAEREMTVRLALHQAPEPDVLVVTTEKYDSDELATFYEADDVVLAIEVVSPDSINRDRDTKPRRYAEAGIKHFWRVEYEAGRAVVYTYELDPATGSYAITGIHHDRLKLSMPFQIDIDLDAVGARPEQ